MDKFQHRVDCGAILQRDKTREIQERHELLPTMYELFQRPFVLNNTCARLKSPGDEYGELS